MLVVVALVMAAMMLAMALPVFAKGQSASAPNCEGGNQTAFLSPGKEDRNERATESLNTNISKCAGSI
jgi:hypothetical protein